jgi:hypothetical protein
MLEVFLELILFSLGGSKGTSIINYGYCIGDYLIKFLRQSSRSHNGVLV